MNARTLCGGCEHANYTVLNLLAVLPSEKRHVTLTMGTVTDADIILSGGIHDLCGKLPKKTVAKRIELGACKDYKEIKETP